MFSLRHVPGPLPTIELSDDDARSLAVIAPERGGIVTRLRVGERELLYMDESTLLDRSKNVRGGNPVLFPSPGKLSGDRFSQGGRQGALKQHGFARNLPWRVEGESTEGAARVSLGLSSTQETLSAYPWAFSARFDYALRGGALRIDMRFRNDAAEPMPFAAGFHPYFLVPQAEKARATIATAATRAFDNVAKREVPFSGFDLTAPEVDMHLVDHGSTEATLSLGDGAVRVGGSAEMTHWVVWTVAGKDYVCLEAWTAPGDALNTGDRLIWLEPGRERALWVEIAAC